MTLALIVFILSYAGVKTLLKGAPYVKKEHKRYKLRSEEAKKKLVKEAKGLIAAKTKKSKN